MDNPTIFKHLGEREFKPEVSHLLQLLHKHETRIVFVKSIIGLANAIYIEENMESGTIPKQHESFFAVFGLNLQDVDKYQAYLNLKTHSIISPQDILDKAKNHLEKTSLPLYVEVGLKETMLTNDDMFSVQSLMKTHKEMEPFEALLKMKKFPEWYSGEVGLDILRRNIGYDLLGQMEHHLALQALEEAAIAIKECLDADDPEGYNEWVTYYHDLKKHHIK